MKIDKQLQKIAPDDIELMDWLPVKYAPKDTAGRSAKFIPTLEMVAALPAFPQPCVLRYPGGIQKSGKSYGLVSGYRPWQGARQRHLPAIRAQVLHVTPEEYHDPQFRARLYLAANPPPFKEFLRRTTSKSERTIYRQLSIGDRLHKQLLDTPLSQAARLALIQVPADEQPAVLAELEHTQRRFTAQNIRTAIRMRAGGSALPDLKPLRDATKLCRQLQQQSNWSENDLELIGPIIFGHANVVKTLLIHLHTQSAANTASDGKS